MINGDDREHIYTGIDLTLTRLAREMATFPPLSEKTKRLREIHSDLLDIRRRIVREVDR